MPTAYIYDGFTAINFDGFELITPRWQSTRLFKAEKQFGGGQDVKDGGSKSEVWVFEFWLKADTGYPTTANTKSAYQKWEDFKKMLKTPSRTYGYQRKVGFDKPDGSGVKTLNGKVSKPVKMKLVAGDNEYVLFGQFEFALDTDDTTSNAQVTGTPS
jgi:hypothetical protein